MNYCRNKMIINVFLIIALILIGSCGKGELSIEDARKELAKLNIQYNEASYYDAIYNNDKMIVELFLKAGMSPNFIFTLKDKGATPLILAAYKNYTEMAKIFIEKGANINYRYSLGPSDEVTPLYFSILTLNYDTCKLLLEKRAILAFIFMKGEYITAEGLLDKMIANKKYFPLSPADSELMDEKMKEKANNIYKLIDHY